MHKYRHRNLLIIILIISVLLSGICLQTVETDSCIVSLYDSDDNAIPANSTFSNTLPISTELCTVEMLGQKNILCLKNHIKRSQDNINRKSGISIITLNFEDIFVFFYSESTADIYQSVLSNVTIISYIHNKDGDKLTHPLYLFSKKTNI